MLRVDRQRATAQKRATAQRVSLEQIRAFFEASDEVRLQAEDRQQVLRLGRENPSASKGWDSLGRASRGLVQRYLAR